MDVFTVKVIGYDVNLRNFLQNELLFNRNLFWLRRITPSDISRLGFNPSTTRGLPLTNRKNRLAVSQSKILKVRLHACLGVKRLTCVAAVHIMINEFAEVCFRRVFLKPVWQTSIVSCQKIQFAVVGVMRKWKITKTAHEYLYYVDSRAPVFDTDTLNLIYLYEPLRLNPTLLRKFNTYSVLWESSSFRVKQCYISSRSEPEPLVAWRRE